MASDQTSISPAAGDGEAPLHPTYRYVIDVMLRTAEKGAKILDYGCGAGEIVVHDRKAGLDMLKTGKADLFPLWGTGTPRREFLHVDDCADACLFLMKHYSGAEHVNVGTGEDLSILELALLVCEIAGVAPRIETDDSKPDGAPRKLLDVTKMRDLGWTASIPLREGIGRTYSELLDQGLLA
jgi:nucleoside-diphosphate-sugar epimerase